MHTYTVCTYGHNVHTLYVAEQSSTNYYAIRTYMCSITTLLFKVNLCVCTYDKICCMPGQRTEVVFVATSDRLPSHPTKDGRATDSCFGLIAPYQCGVLMVIVGWLAASVSTPSRTLVVSTEAGRGYISVISVTVRSMVGWKIITL